MNKRYFLSALVPMKGKSQRVKSKNLRKLGGKPLFFHILNSLETAEFISEIIVDTDSEEIIDLIKENFPDVRIVERPDFLLGDKVPMTPIIGYDLKRAKNEYFLQTHATNPLLKAETIDRAVKTYFEGLSEGFDSVIGVNRFQTRFYDQKRNPINHNPDIMVPSQDMAPIYEDNSNFYINSKDNFYQRNNRVGVNPFLMEVPKLEAIDVDEEEDFIIVQAVYEYLRREKKESK